jgi:hypothetical protein
MEISLGFMRSLCGLMGFNCQYGILGDYCKPSINGVLWGFTIQYVDVWGLSLQSPEDMTEHGQKISAQVLNMDQKPLNIRHFTITK